MTNHFFPSILISRQCYQWVLGIASLFILSGCNPSPDLLKVPVLTSDSTPNLSDAETKQTPFYKTKLTKKKQSDVYVDITPPDFN